MEHIGLALASVAMIDPGRALAAAAGALIVGGIIFLKRNSRNIQERLRKNHG
ncbi:hypothetical protein [uncultured Merdimonas sp.]|uniref:hypothetical protein n=1 Tax=uncultured Merdimonas sp. TaxID=2023269 RepID=UPI00320857EE